MKIRQRKDLSNFIRHVTEKNYSAAHKYLQAVMEARLAERIKVAAKKPLF